jgi:hypothetical protein
MCGRYTLTPKKVDDLSSRFDAVLNTREQVKDGRGRHNVAPGAERPRGVDDRPPVSGETARKGPPLLLSSPAGRLPRTSPGVC